MTPSIAAPAGRIEKLVLFTGFSCNSYCHFCIDLNKRDVPDKSTQQIIREMVEAKGRGVEYLEMIGGEATIRGDFLALVRTAKKLGFKDVVVVTNGRMLRGIENVRAGGLGRVFANCTVVKPNVAHLPDIGRLLLRLKMLHAEFIFVDPNYGGAYSNFEGQVPLISEASAAMRETLDIGRAGGTRDWTARYVPLCHFTDYLDQISELREVRLFRTRHWAPDFQNEDVGGSRKAAGRLKTERCSGCRLEDRCEGLWKEYLKRRGDLELVPVP